MKVYRQKNARKILFLFLCIFAIQLFIPNFGNSATFVVLLDFLHEPILLIEFIGFSTSFILGLIASLRMEKMTKTGLKTTRALFRASILLVVFWIFHDFAYLTTASPIILPTRGLFTLIPLFYIRKILKRIEINRSTTSGAFNASEKKELTINQIQPLVSTPWAIPLIDSTIIFLILMFIPSLGVDQVDYIFFTPYRTESLFEMLLSRLSYFWLSYDPIILFAYLLSIALLVGIWSSLELRNDLKGESKMASLHAVKLIKCGASLYLFWILHGLLVSPTPSCYYTICEINIPLRLLLALPFGIHLFWKAYRFPVFESPKANEIGQKLSFIDDESIQIMHAVGIKSLRDLAEENPGELSKILVLPEEQVKKWIHAANDAIPELPLKILPTLDDESIKIMEKVGIKSLYYLAKENSTELCKILEIPQEQVEKWIQDARETLSKLSKEET